MARNILVELYNNNQLIEMVGAGSLSEDGERFTFSGPDKYGCMNGNRYTVHINTGIVERYNLTTDKTYIFGDKESSGDARGYMNVEMVVEYDEEVFTETSENNYYYNSGRIVGVQYTCYIQKIIEAIKICKYGGRRTLSDCANHMNGCKMHNYIGNIESSSSEVNCWHGAVFTSMVHSGRTDFGVLHDSNKKHVFPYLGQGISVDWVMEFMWESKHFDNQVRECTASLRNKKKGEVKYMTDCSLIQFADYLRDKGYWK